MKRTLFLLLLIGMSYSAQSQYTHALGFRGGFFSGITYKTFVSSDMAIEAIAHSRYGGFQLTGLAEWHAGAFEVEGLNWYYGAGGHIGAYSYNDNPWFDEEFSGSRAVIGVDGILGIEYNIGSIPINVSLDWKPAFNIIGYTGFLADGGAFSVRYTW